MRARLGESPHPVVIDELFGKEILADADVFAHVMRVNIAHASVLARAGVIPQDHGEALIDLYLGMLKGGLGAITLDPRLEDLHLNLERHVIEVLGKDIGGRMHTGRSRNDLNATVARMQTRDQILTLIEHVLRLRRVLIRQAKKHAATIMAGYTHLQPAQPITLGYYFAAVADAIHRDARRIQSAYSTTNLSPLGAGPLAGSVYPLDRRLAAALLGFEGVLDNALDAVASRDYMLEFLAAAAGLATTISRLAQDLQVWASVEFGLVEFGDDTCIVSSVMPQKKNPVPLEHCKGKAGHVVGSLVAALTATHATAFSNSRDVNREVPRALRTGIAEMTSSVRLMTASLDGLTAHTGRMRRAAESGFATATDLADLLVTKFGLPFRSAHEVVATVIRELLDGSGGGNQITAEHLRRIAKALTGRSVDIDDAVVAFALDPATSVRNRATAGSPGPTHLATTIERLARGIDRDRAWLRARRRRLTESDGALLRTRETQMDSKSGSDDKPRATPAGIES